VTSHRPASPLDVLMFRGERYPRTRSAMVAVYLLDRVPEWGRLFAHFENVSRVYPGLRERIVEATVPLVDARWVTDPDFDLAYHVRRIEVDAPGALRQVLDVAEAVMMAPLDTARPLWEAILIEGLTGGQGALVMKLSHAITDGVGGMQLQQFLFDTERDAPARGQASEPLAVVLTPTDITMAAVRRLPMTVLGVARSALTGVRGVARNPLSLNRFAQHAVDFARALPRSLFLPSPPSPLLAGRSWSRRFLWADVALDDLRRGAKAGGGTVNDAYLAALAGAVGRYHEQMGVPVAAVSVYVPVNLRANDAQGGNQWGAVSIALPMAEPDPKARMLAIGRTLREARNSPALGALRAASTLMSRTPSALISAFSDAVPRADLQASNVPGWPTDSYLCGAKVERFLGFGPLPGAAMMVVLLSNAGACVIGVNYDPAAVTRPDLFQSCLEDAIAEVVALGPPPPRPARPARKRAASAVKAMA
jgi:diacylglycerol O-acyltransferase / wax synthase